MNRYEIMFIVRPDIDEESLKKTVKTLEKALTDNMATITLTKELGQKELAYEINKHKSGYYYLYNIETKDTLAINEFARLAKINENIIRQMIINLDK